MTGRHETKAMLKTSSKYNLLSAAIAFALWGGWACFINGGFGAVGMRSGLTQGAASFIITLFMVRSVAWLFSRMPNTILQVLAPGMITVAFTGSGLAAVHYLVGTPEIIKTISPALSVAFIFCVYTSLKLGKANQ